jgi:hypothetical protein
LLVRHFSLFFGVLMVGLLAGARPAAADIPPLGSCRADEVGQACDEAVNEAQEVVGPGVCVAETCTRASREGPISYDCTICRSKPAEPGAGGASNDPARPTAGSGNAPKPSAGASNDPVEPSAGRAGSATGGSSTSAGTTSKPTEKPEADRDGGCTMSAGGRGAGTAGLASLLVLGLAIARRRSQRDHA